MTNGLKSIQPPTFLTWMVSDLKHSLFFECHSFFDLPIVFSVFLVKKMCFQMTCTCTRGSWTIQCLSNQWPLFRALLGSSHSWPSLHCTVECRKKPMREGLQTVGIRGVNTRLLQQTAAARLLAPTRRNPSAWLDWLRPRIAKKPPGSPVLIALSL